MTRKTRILLLAAVAAAVAFADDDPPSRVARLNYINGSVSFQPGSMDNWAPATLNYPLTTGDHLWTDQRAGAELHVGSTAIRMAAETNFGFLNLDDRAVQIRVSQGSVSIRLNRLDEDETFEVDAPNAAISLLRPGHYRIDVNADGTNTRVTVRGGDAEVTAGASPFPLHARQTAQISGTDSATYEVSNAGPPDAWDRWSMDRDQREERAASTKYVSREMIGYEDLDEYGAWRTHPAYGPLWVPARVTVGWAPYRFGALGLGASVGMDLG
jgi:hypothetical protein